MDHQLVPQLQIARLTPSGRTPRSPYSRPALWSTLLTALVVTIGSLGPFTFRTTYGHFLNRHYHIYGPLYVTPHALLHFWSFGLLGFLASLVSARWPVRGYAISAVITLGLLVEWTQFTTHPGNRFESWDLRNDAIGALLGALLAYTCSARRRASYAALTM
jgi:VanZ family protein